MVLKQCHTRLKSFALTNPEKWYDPAHNQDKVSFISWLPANVCPKAVNVSAGLNIPPDSNCGKQLWRRGQVAGPKVMHLPAVTRLFVRELSTSIKSLQYDLKPEEPKSSGVQKLFFDTHAVVRLLEENGFSTQQAEVVVKVLVRMTNSNMDTIYSDMVTKVQQEIMLQRVMSQIAAVKKDMIILEKSEFSALLAENEKVKIHLLQLRAQLADVMNQVRSDTVLEMNLEKSRVKELKSEHEKNLLETRNEIMEMTAEQDRNLTQANMKIDTEVAGLKTMLESHKLDTIKYLAGSVFTCLTVVLGFYRIWM